MGELILTFIAGLAGSAHCLGMCGGIVGALAIAAPSASSLQRFYATAAYHVGRIVTYTVLGLAAGALSEALFLSNFSNIINYLFLFSNLIIIIIGAATAAGLSSISFTALDGSPFTFMEKILSKAIKSSSLFPFFIVGLAFGLMPCGLVYGVLATAAATASWQQGVLRMCAFGLGTMPAMMLYGQIASTIRHSFGSVFTRLTGVVVLILGLTGIFEALFRLGYLERFVFPK